MARLRGAGDLAYVAQGQIPDKRSLKKIKILDIIFKNLSRKDP
jgi:hypothetical protein